MGLLPGTDAQILKSILPPGELRPVGPWGRSRFNRILTNRPWSLTAKSNGHLSGTLKTTGKLAFNNNAKNTVNFHFQGER